MTDKQSTWIRLVSDSVLYTYRNSVFPRYVVVVSDMLWKWDRVLPIPEGKKDWVNLEAGCSIPMGASSYLLSFSGMRSDGQMFMSQSVLEPQSSLEATGNMLNDKARKAFAHLMSFSDCTCGITGYEEGAEKDEDGVPIMVPVYQYCTQHPPMWA